MTLLDALVSRRDPVSARSISPSMIPWGRGDDVGDFSRDIGVRVDRDTALGISAVWACVSLISDSIATLPVDTHTRSADGVIKPYRPRPAWLDVPNEEQTKVDFIFGTVASLLMDGVAPIYTVRNRKQDIVEAWILDPRWVQIRREYLADGSLGIVYYVMVGKGMQSPVGPFRVEAGPDMFHINAFQPNASWPRGIGPLEVARLMFGSGIAGQKMGARFFGQGMNAAGVIEVPDDLTVEQGRQLKEDFTRANSGLDKMHLPPVLTGGAKWSQIQISPEQSQFIEQRKFSVDEIARFFRVPPHMIGNLEKTSSWGAGIEQQSIGFVQYTLRPWIERIEEAWSRHMLLFDRGAFIRFDVDGLLRGDHAAMADYWQKRFQSASASPNDIKRAFGETPIDDGDTYYYPVNMAPVGTEPLKIDKLEATEPNLKEPISGDVATVPTESNSLSGHSRETIIVPVPGEREGFVMPERMIDAVEQLGRSLAEKPVPPLEPPPRPRAAVVRRDGDTLTVTYQDDDAEA